MLVFFFSSRRRHTRFSRDWSSDVCLPISIGDQLTCVFVDNGLLRHGERALVEKTFRDHFKIDLRVVDASKQFLADLAGVTDPQEIGRASCRESEKIAGVGGARRREADEEE